MWFGPFGKLVCSFRKIGIIPCLFAIANIHGNTVYLGQLNRPETDCQTRSVAFVEEPLQMCCRGQRGGFHYFSDDMDNSTRQPVTIVTHCAQSKTMWPQVPVGDDALPSFPRLDDEKLESDLICMVIYIFIHIVCLEYI
jgi:hypothetical protein